MALRGKVVVRAVGYTLVGLAILAFGSRLVLKVMDGQSLETYYSGTLVRWSYGAALVALIALACAALVAGGILLASWLRTRRELARLAQTPSKLGPDHG